MLLLISQSFSVKSKCLVWVSFFFFLFNIFQQTQCIFALCALHPELSKCKGNLFPVRMKWEILRMYGMQQL